MDNSERLKVMKLVQESKITPEEGMELLEMLDKKEKPQKPVMPEAARPVGQGKWLRVNVTDMDTGKLRVNVRVPLGLVNAGMKLGSKFAPEVDGINFEEVIQAAREGGTGEIIDVYDEDDREHVEIFIE